MSHRNISVIPPHHWSNGTVIKSSNRMVTGMEQFEAKWSRCYNLFFFVFFLKLISYLVVFPFYMLVETNVNTSVKKIWMRSRRSWRTMTKCLPMTDGEVHQYKASKGWNVGCSIVSGRIDRNLEDCNLQVGWLSVASLKSPFEYGEFPRKIYLFHGG